MSLRVLRTGVARPVASRQLAIGRLHGIFMIRKAFSTGASQHGIYREQSENVNGFSLNDDAARARTGGCQRPGLARVVTRRRSTGGPVSLGARRAFFELVSRHRSLPALGLVSR